MDRRLSRLFATVIVTAILLGALPIIMPAVKAAPPLPPVFWIVPDTLSFNTDTTPVGTLFNVTLYAGTASDVFAYNFGVKFDPTQLQVRSVGIHDDGANWTHNSASSEWWFGHALTAAGPLVDNVVGEVTGGESLQGSGVVPASTGSIIWIQFQIIAAPTPGNTLTSTIDPNTPESYFLDPDLNVILGVSFQGAAYSYASPAPQGPKPPVALFDYSPKPVVVGQMVTFDASASYDPDGTVVGWNWDFGDSGTDSGKIVTHAYSSAGNYIVNLTVTDDEFLTNSTAKQVPVLESQPARLYVDPAEIIDPNLFPPAIVTINVSVDFVTNMYDYAFNLTYDTNMLTCIGAVINRVQGQTSFTPLILIDDGAGFIWISVVYHPPAVPISTVTPLALVTVYFQIDTIGSSVLHLKDTELSDPSHQSMPHDTGDGFIMTLIRDVAITGVVPSTDWAYQGWPVSVQVTARNNGNISENFDVTAYYDGGVIGTIPVVNLASDSDTVLTFNWNTGGVAEGSYTISARASTVPFEYNTTNNYLEDDQVQILTTIRDVAITNVTTSRDWAFPGMPVNVTVTAKNVGDVTESFYVTAFYDANLLGNVSIVGLAPGADFVEVFKWNTTGLTPCNNFTISGQASSVPFEFNTTNNIFVDGGVKMRIVGDISGDGKVDIRDVAIVSAAFGSRPGSSRWNPDADITGIVYLVPDGVIDIRDVAVVSKNYGKKC